MLGLRAAPRLSGPRGRPSLQSGRGCACARSDADSAPLVSRRRSDALPDGVLRELGEGADERDGQAGWEEVPPQSLKKTPKPWVVRALELEAPGVVCALELGVPGVVRQLVLVDGLFVAGSLWPWRKGPTILEAPKVLQSREEEGGIC